MTIEVLNESGHDLDIKALAALSRFVMDKMRVHPMAELCIKAVDEPTIAELNERWMEKEGPTDVLAFPMDELRPGLVNEEPEEGVLGDLGVVLDGGEQSSECTAIALARGVGKLDRPLAGGHRAAMTAVSPTSARSPG